MANNNLVGSLVRSMDIVKLIGETPEGLQLGEIATALQLKIPTCYNLVRTLVSGGFLEKRNKRFFFGRELKRIAELQEESPFVEQAEAELLSLYQRIPRGTVIFGEASKYGFRQTLRISFDRPGVIQHLEHEPMHPYATASGLIGLAFAGEDSYLLQSEKWPFAEFGIVLWKERATLDAFLDEIRKTKIAVSPFDRDIFLRVAGAVFGPHNTLLGTIGASVPSNQLIAGGVEAICTEVVDSAERLSAAFGN